MIFCHNFPPLFILSPPCAMRYKVGMMHLDVMSNSPAILLIIQIRIISNLGRLWLVLDHATWLLRRLLPSESSSKIFLSFYFLLLLFTVFHEFVVWEKSNNHNTTNSEKDHVSDEWPAESWTIVLLCQGNLEEAVSFTQFDLQTNNPKNKLLSLGVDLKIFQGSFCGFVIKFYLLWFM